MLKYSFLTSCNGWKSKNTFVLENSKDWNIYKNIEKSSSWFVTALWFRENWNFFLRFIEHWILETKDDQMSGFFEFLSFNSNIWSSNKIIVQRANKIFQYFYFAYEFLQFFPKKISICYMMLKNVKEKKWIASKAVEIQQFYSLKWDQCRLLHDFFPFFPRNYKNDDQLNQTPQKQFMVTQNAMAKIPSRKPKA